MDTDLEELEAYKAYLEVLKLEAEVNQSDGKTSVGGNPTPISMLIPRKSKEFRILDLLTETHTALMAAHVSDPTIKVESEIVTSDGVTELKVRVKQS